MGAFQEDSYDDDDDDDEKETDEVIEFNRDDAWNPSRRRRRICRHRHGSVVSERGLKRLQGFNSNPLLLDNPPILFASTLATRTRKRIFDSIYTLYH